jgi:hypothetical protein
MVLAPGPAMVRDWLILRVVVRAMGEEAGHDKPVVKLIVSPADAWATF